MSKRGVPQNLEYERLLLGLALLYEESLHALRPVLEDADFTAEKNRTVWRRICALYDAGTAVEAVTVYQALRMAGEADSVGGISYLADLETGVPRLSSIDSYVAGLKDKTLLRKLMHASQLTINRCLSGEETGAAILDSLSQTAATIAPQASGHGLESAGDIIDEVGISRILRPRRDAGLQFPWPWMNYRTGGMLPAELWILAGHTSTGKTSAMLQHAVTVARRGEPVSIFSLEVGRESLLQKAIYQIARVDSEAGKRGKLSADDRRVVTAAADEVHELPLYLDTASSTTMAIHAAVRRLKAKHTVKHVIVDYLQLLGDSGRQENRAQAVGANAWALKLLATDFQVPVLLLSQFTRESNKPGKQREPALTDLKESGDIENHANGVWFLHRPNDEDSNQIPMKFILAKQRDGRRNVWQDFYFYPQYQRFEQVTQEEYE